MKTECREDEEGHELLPKRSYVKSSQLRIDLSLFSSFYSIVCAFAITASFVHVLLYAAGFKRWILNRDSHNGFFHARRSLALVLLSHVLLTCNFDQEGAQTGGKRDRGGPGV
jgi:hypothetical protein